MCEQCAEGFYNYPLCEECDCDPAGVIDVPGQPLGGCGSATEVREEHFLKESGNGRNIDHYLVVI